jgi:capsular exopolysaccharide synthesis family protein
MAEHTPEHRFDAPEADDSSAGFLRMVWQRKALVALGVVVGLVAGTLVYVQRAPVYQSSAQVLVAMKRSGPLPITGGDPRMSFVEDYVATHLVVIRSQVVVEQAVRKRNLQALPSFAGVGDPTGVIIASLSATRDTKDSSGAPNNVINLTYRGPVAEDCRVVLNAVIDSYQEFLDQTYEHVSKETLEKISDVHARLKGDLAKSQKDYDDFRKKSPLVFKGKDGMNVYQERVASLEAKKSALMLHQAELRDRLAVIEKATREGHGRKAALALMGAGGRDKPVAPDAGADEKLLPLLLEEQQLLQTYAEDYPGLIAVRKRIALIRQALRPVAPDAGSAEAKAAAADEAAMADPVARYLESLHQELKETDVTRASVEELLVGVKKEARDLSDYEADDDRLRGEIASLKQLNDVTMARLREINLVRDSAGVFDARVLARPGAGGKVAPSAVQFVGAGLMIGLLGGLGLAYLAERADRGFRTPEEIRRRLGLPVLGHIPVLTGDEAARAQAESGAAVLDPLTCVHYRPRSVDAESYRAVRTALYFSAQGGNCQVVQVTSPAMGDGKTTLAVNLAISIAQSGKRTLLVDADLRRPRLHKALGVPGQIGLASVIAGQAELAAAVRETSVSGLSVLPCGPVPVNPAELLTSPRFKEVIDQLRGQYEFVLIDTPPLLAVTDPSVVAPRADGVLLTIRLSRNSGPQALRAKEVLAGLGARVLGVVVNGASQRGGPGRYVTGRYEYAYAEDGYEPEDDEGAAYYESHGGDPAPAGNGTAVEKSWRRDTGRPRSRPAATGFPRSGLLRRFFLWWG